MSGFYALLRASEPGTNAHSRTVSDGMELAPAEDHQSRRVLAPVGAARPKSAKLASERFPDVLCCDRPAHGDEPNPPSDPRGHGAIARRRRARAPSATLHAIRSSPCQGGIR